MTLADVIVNKENTLSVEYQEIRSKIKSGDVLAWSHRGWSSWHDIKVQIVRMFTRSEYSHVGVAWVIGERVFVIEAVMPLVRIYPLSKLGDFYHLGMEADWSHKAEEYALSHVGDEYSQLQAIKAYFTSLGKDNTSECAALVIAIMARCGIQLDCKAVPSDVILEIQKSGKHITYVHNGG